MGRKRAKFAPKRTNARAKIVGPDGKQFDSDAEVYWYERILRARDAGIIRNVHLFHPFPFYLHGKHMWIYTPFLTYSMVNPREGQKPLQAIDVLPKNYVYRMDHDPMVAVFKASNPDYDLKVVSNRVHSSNQAKALQRRRSMLSPFSQDVVPILT